MSYYYADVRIQIDAKNDEEAKHKAFVAAFGMITRNALSLAHIQDQRLLVIYDEDLEPIAKFNFDT